MKAALVAIATILALLLQNRISIFGIPPALTLVIVYLLGIRLGALKGMLAGALIGAVEDSAAGGILGPALLSKGVVGFSASFASGGLFRWTPVLGVIAVALFTVLDGLTVFVARFLYETPPAPLSRVVVVLVVQGIMNAAAGPFIRPPHAE